MVYLCMTGAAKINADREKLLHERQAARKTAIENERAVQQDLARMFLNLNASLMSPTQSSSQSLWIEDFEDALVDEEINAAALVDWTADALRNGGFHGVRRVHPRPVEGARAVPNSRC